MLFIIVKLTKIEIPKNSELQTIENNAFSFSSLQSLTIPSKLIDLKEGLCDGISYLNKIEISSKCMKMNF